MTCDQSVVSKNSPTSRLNRPQAAQCPTDKAIGTLLSAGRLPGNSFGLLVSGRASFELMQKALVAGIPLLAAVGAPSSLAVQMAKEFDMTLIGFLRGDTFNIYNAPERVGRGDIQE